MTTFTWLAGNGLWANPAKWDQGAVPGTTPTDGDKVVITGSNTIDLGSLSALTLGSLDLSGFTGTLTTSAIALGITIRYATGGVCYLPAAMTLTIAAGGNGLTIALQNNDSVSINVGCATVYAFTSGSTGGDTLTGNMTVGAGGFTTVGAFNQGAKTITGDPQIPTADYFFTDIEGVLLWSAGASFVIGATSASGLVELGYSGPSGGFPPLILNGCVLTPYTVIPASTFTMNAGSLTGADGGSWAITGAAVAHNANISGSNFSGGTALNASDACVNGGSNTNVNFAAVVVATGTVRHHPGGSLTEYQRARRRRLKPKDIEYPSVSQLKPMNPVDEGPDPAPATPLDTSQEIPAQWNPRAAQIAFLNKLTRGIR